MAKSLFSVPIFFIAFRECLEASLIIAILLGLVEQIVQQQSPTITTNNADEKDSSSASGSGSGQNADSANTNVLENDTATEETVSQKVLIRRLRIQERVDPSTRT